MTALRIAFGRGVCGTLDEAARREWLVTDGLGGYASGTIAGLRTRRYHGLGSVCETADGDAPHHATGCPFQAWSVAELTRSKHWAVTEVRHRTSHAVHPARG
jgi:glycogen debranching enzyme